MQPRGVRPEQVEREFLELFITELRPPEAVANADAFKVVGGGHTIAAIEKYELANKVDHMSTGGGSLMNFLSGKKLPAIEALKKSKEKYESGGYKNK